MKSYIGLYFFCLGTYRLVAVRIHTCVTALDRHSRCMQSGAANARCTLGQTRAIRLNAHQLCRPK